MTKITARHKEIQTRNYWQACQWLADKTTAPAQRDHAAAILKAIANCPDLDDLSAIAKQTLENNYIDVIDFNLWAGTRS